jgi:NAD+ synthase (glutamine-hydrolysing)
MDADEDTGRTAGGFGSLYRHGFARVAVAIPGVTVADPASNAGQIIALARQAAGEHAVLTVFPELSLSSYTADDLFHQDALQDAVLDALRDVVAASSGLGTALVVGAPLRTDGLLFNCAVVVCEGTVRGVVPKSYLPNYREFYEKRYFAAARDTAARQIRLLGQDAAFGPDLLFDAEGLDGFSFHVEICEDLWVPVPPSTWAALGGATVLVNLSASNIVVGKAAYRRQLCQSQSARCIAAYLYAASGSGESTTDLAWDGDALIYENGERLAEGTRFAASGELVTADIDLQRLAQDRMRITSFADARHDHASRLSGLRRIPVALAEPRQEARLRREIPRFPYVPADRADRDERCAEVYHIQVQGLVQRLRATGIGKVVIGVSGGLDSAHALTIAAESMDRLGTSRRNILAYTMPGFATSEGTLGQARQLMTALGATPGEIDIRPSARQMLRDIGHPAAEGRAVYDVTYENVQAGERTSHLFRLANRNNAMVVGTGDLSELALGWCTFGVGDQMSHYNVNASVPKTLIQHLIRWSVESRRFTGAAAAALRLVLDTEISPELVPAAHGRLQSSQDVIGPYDLQDFHLYYLLRFGYRPSRIAYLAHHAWGDQSAGRWPEPIPEGQRHEYDLPAIKAWLAVFLQRFVQTSQFKRSTLPNAPKVGSGGSLSPRGDWRAPSDATARAWLDELARNVPG